MKQKIVALLLCFFLGGFGVHKFYLGQIGWGVAYLLFFWTYIPFIAAFVEFLILAFMSEEDFNRQFNPQMFRGYPADPTYRNISSPMEATQALKELKNLYDAGIITEKTP